MKRILVLCLAALACYMAVTGTVAYFTDSVETTGVIASGNLHVLQHEYERSGETLRSFTQGKPLFPAVVGEAATEERRLGDYAFAMNTGVSNYVDKIVTAENKGSLKLYARTYIAVPSFSETVPVEPWLHLEFNGQDYDGAAWRLDETGLSHVEIEGQHYDICALTYTALLEPGDSTPPSLLGFYMDGMVTNEKDQLVYTDDSGRYELGGSESLQILVATVASQANEQVFAGVDQAMANTFPEGYHPWQDVTYVASQAELDAAVQEIAEEKSYNAHIWLDPVEGGYTLAGELPAGMRFFGRGEGVALHAASLTAQDVEFDSVRFEEALSFTGWGSFENVTFGNGWTAHATEDLLFADCVFGDYAIASGEDQVSILRCTKPDGTPVITEEME